LGVLPLSNVTPDNGHTVNLTLTLTLILTLTLTLILSNPKPYLTQNGGNTCNLFLMSKSELQREKFKVHCFILFFSRAEAVGFYTQ